MPDLCLTQAEYSFHNNQPIIHLFGRDSNGESHRVDVVGFKPYFFIPSNESPKVLPPAELDLNEYFSIRHEPLVKVYVPKPTDIKDAREKFSKHYEADILYTLRFLIDAKIKSGFSYTQSPCTLEDIKPVDLNYPARVCIIDIECSDENGFPDATKDPIFCISAYDNFSKRYITFVVATLPLDETPKENGCFNTNQHDVLTYTDEKSLLVDFADYIKNTDPDIITGWNSGDFDVPYILGRFDKLGIPRNTLSRLNNTNTDRVEIKGRQLFDLLAGYKRMHLGEQPSYRLDAIAAEELGKQKVRFAGKVCDLWKNDPTSLVHYNYTDVELCVGIDAKDKTVEFHRYVAQYVGCPLEKTTNSMPIIDTLVLREAREHGFILPSKVGVVNAQESFEGATVIAPMVGVQENVIVLDAKSLYPMSMMTINASPETKDPNGELRAPNGIRFKKEPDGLVRKIQMKFLRERDELKKERNKYPFDSEEYKNLNMRQDVVKINMNSYYGVSGNPMFRLNDRDVGAAVTSVGRALLEHNKKLVEEEGYKIVQGDSVGKNSKIMLYDKFGNFKFYGSISDAFDICTKNSYIYKIGDKEYSKPFEIYTDTIDENGKLSLKKVKYIMRHECGKKMYRVNITNMWSVDVTEDHSLIGHKNVNHRIKKKQNRFVEVKPTDIKKVANSIVVKKVSTRSTEENYKFPKEVYELMGYFIGCGSFEAKSKRLSLAAGEDIHEVLEKIFVPLEQSGWISRFYIKSETKGDICFYGDISTLIKTSIRVGSIGKKIPKFIYEESFENQCSFLRGLFSSDGTVMIRKGRPMIRYCSINVDLCKEIQLLLHVVGISSSVFKDNTVNTYNGVISGTYSHLVNIKSMEDFSKNIGFIENRKQNRIANFVSLKKRYLRNMDYDISSVKSVEEIKYDDYVYDLEVEDTHNFFANNILVHNTDGLSIKIPKSIGREGTMVIAKELEQVINDSYPQFAKEVLNADTQYFSVKFEKLYARFFSGGKKKRYAGLLVWKEGVDAHKIDIVGFETKRSDSPKVTRDAMKVLIEMVLEGEPYDKIRSTISDIIRKYRAGKYTLDEIGIPGGIGKALEDYDVQDAQVRAAIYSNTYFGTNFGKGSKPKRLYIKNVTSKYPRTDVVCFEYADQIPREFVIDLDTMLEKTLQLPLTRILQPLGWEWSSFDPEITTLSQWGI